MEQSWNNVGAKSLNCPAFAETIVPLI